MSVDNYNDFDRYSDEDMYSNKNKFDQDFKNSDIGYNKIYRKMPDKNGNLKRKCIEIYTSSGTGSYIRDAESGDYTNDKVGSVNEDLYYSVRLATGECKSKNGSSLLFYRSPQHFMQHLNCEVNTEDIYYWEDKRNMRIREIKLAAEKKTCIVK